MQYLLETVEPWGVRMATLSEVSARLGTVDAAFVVCGHTHVPRAMRASTGQLVVNPGSVGLPAYDACRPCPHAIETGSPDARYAIVEQRDAQWQCTHVVVPYKHQAMAQLAQSRDRTDWAMALATGYVKSQPAKSPG
jgi:diadenosine tetraphosphatase ApaH/serine/threonine PP2A family protein phosphatase